MIGFIPVLLVSADDDDYLETLEDASGEPLNTDMSYYNDSEAAAGAPYRQGGIEWGEFDDTDVTTFRTTATGEIQFPITKKYFGSVSGRTGITTTNFSGDNQFIDTGKSSGRPWSDLYEVALRFRSKYVINDRWGLAVASWMTSRWEQGSSPQRRTERRWRHWRYLQRRR